MNPSVLPSAFAISAAMNNARWCDLMCRVHGAPGEFGPSFWLNAGSVPPFYPNLVTTSPADPEGHHSAVERLIAATGGRTVSAKDSFQRLDLAPFGFAKLFDAQWYAALPGTFRHSQTDPGDSGEWLDTEDAIRAWEAAGTVTEGPDRPCFPASLLLDPGVGVLAFRDREAIVGGAIAYRWRDSLGNTNIFGRTAFGAPIETVCVRVAAAKYPGTMIVGYEAVETVQALELNGALALGTLTVWLKAA